MVHNEESIRRIKQIKIKHKGLEILTIACQHIHDARVSIIPIGEPSTGKSTLGISLQYPESNDKWTVFDFQKMSIHHILEEWTSKSNEKDMILQDYDIDLIFDDYHALSKRSREMFREDIPSWISKSPNGIAKYHATKGTISFDHCRIFVWIPIQFESFANLMMNVDFREYIADRYIKIPDQLDTILAYYGDVFYTILGTDFTVAKCKIRVKTLIKGDQTFASIKDYIVLIEKDGKIRALGLDLSRAIEIKPYKPNLKKFLHDIQND